MYEQIAPEYYQSERHPTSANLREASLKAVRALLTNSRPRRICELGAGRSIFIDLPEFASDLIELVLVDASPRMLHHSDQLPDARRIVADVHTVDLPQNHFDLIVAPLGDPFNTHAAWSRTIPSLIPGGLVLYTGPSLTWARRFRRAHQNDRIAEADFETETGPVSVPSFVRSQSEQSDLWYALGLIPVRWIEIYPADVSEPHSQKILDSFESLCIGSLASHQSNGNATP